MNAAANTRPDEAETRELLRRARAGDHNAREQLAEQNFPLVNSIVRRFIHSGREREDLFQVGCIGLLKAIDRFDTGYDVCFSTYAVPLIMGEIRRFLRDDRPISVSRGLRQRAIEIARCRQELRQKNGREPDIQTLSRHCHLAPELIVIAAESQKPLLSITELLRPPGSDQQRAEDSVSALAVDDTEQMTERLNMARMLEELPDRLAYILRGRYFEDKTQTALAKELGISQVQISRLEKKALRLIKEKVEA